MAGDRAKICLVSFCVISFDRALMRTCAGFSFPFGSKATLGIGYLNQYTFGSAGKSDEIAHILNTSVGIKF